MSDFLTNVFNSDLFTVQALTAAVNRQPHIPGRVGQLGIFNASGIIVPSVVIEQVDGVVQLIPDTPRGGPPKVLGTNRRKAFSMRVPHLPTRATIMADQVRGVRAFGSTNQLAGVEQVRDQKLASHRSSLDATVEYGRIGAIKGVIYDADGATVLQNLFTLFGETQNTVALELNVDATKIRNKCTAIARLIEAALGAATYTGIRALVGKNVFDSLIEHPEVKKPYLNWMAAADLTEDKRKGFPFGGIVWEEYRGSVTGADGTNAVQFIGDDEGYVFPEGVPGLFITNFAPADYIETVNTVGLPIYAKSELMDFGKGIEVEMQTNPLSYCTRPKVLIKVTKT